jgi:thioredoxin 1
MEVLHFTNESFSKEVLESKGLVLVDFWAPWCGPCRMLSPILEEVAKEVESVKVGKVNVDEERGLAERYDIMSIPAVFLFKDGERVETMIGVKPKEEYLEVLKNYS